MPLPDVQQYIPLPLIDKDPQDIFEASVAQGRITLGGWEPRESNVEVMLLELFALEVAEAVYAINRLPDSIVYTMLQLFGITHDGGATPTVELKFELAVNNGFTIPAGTNARFQLPSGDGSIVFSTAQDLIIPNGSSEGTVLATSESYTAEANGMAVGTQGILLDAISYVDYVSFATSPSGGRDQESDLDYFTRGVQKFQRLTSTLVLPSHFTSAALEYEDVARATTLDNYNPANDADNNGPVGNDEGHVTVVVYGQNELLDQASKDGIKSDMVPLALSNLSIHVVDPTINTVNVTANIRVDPGFPTNQAIANVVGALQEYLNPATWAWNTVVPINELISIITNAEGVDYVDDLISPSANLQLTGVAPLVTTGNLNIQVVA